MTARDRCGHCRRPLDPDARHVQLALVSRYGRPVEIILHDICAPLVQGAIAVQMRGAAMQLDATHKRARAERQAMIWWPSDLRLLRRRLGLTQEQLARRLGVSRQTVSLHERGGDPWPGMTGTLNRLDEEAVRRTGRTHRDDRP